MEKKKVVVGASGIIILSAVAAVTYWALANKDLVSDMAAGNAYLGPVLLVILEVFNSLAVFIPGNFTAFIAGYIFGFWEGLAINIVGTLLGTAALFFFARKASKIFDYSGFTKKHMKSTRALMDHGRYRWSAYIISRVIPFSPADAVTLFVASFTKNSFWEFMLFSTIGSLPDNVLETLAGYLFRRFKANFPTLTVGIIIALVVIAVLFVWNRLAARKGKGERKKTARGKRR
jgi:uncharacterized membrane protein YdjX (TVP38/TMEM64 family)